LLRAHESKYLSPGARRGQETSNKAISLRFHSDQEETTGEEKGKQAEGG
jgi:hypothetical protein